VGGEVKETLGPGDGFLEEVEGACLEAERDPSLLARPLRVVVPSNALREHLAATLVARAGRARLGVQIGTLDALAHEVLGRGGRALGSDVLYPIAVRERARREAALARDLDGLDDGYASVVATVDDLLDAGFTAGHADVLAEPLAEAASGPLRARIEALLRVASAVSDELAAGRLGHRSALLSGADACLRAADVAEHLLPARAVWIVGFNDATGVQLDLLETLVQRLGAEVWLDTDATGSSFGERLRERLTPMGRVRFAAPPPAPVLIGTRHADPEGEARAAAVWARERLDDSGGAPERIAIIARDLTRYRLALRRQLRRHGVPFSGVGERGAPGPAGRRLGALVDLLERGSALPAERWLDALATGLASADLRDALHVAGVATLGDLVDATPRTWSEAPPLPARTGSIVAKDGSVNAPHRCVDAKRLASAASRAKRTLRALAAAPARAPLAERVAQLVALVETLGWEVETPGRAELDEVFPDAEHVGKRDVPREDWPRLLRRALGDAGTDAFGGSGGGVQVLTVMEARARRFDAVRVIGLNRGVFPRRLAEDPLLPDALRRVLRVVLPDLPVKTESHEEERFLFAQLLGSAPRVWLSCARTDAAGRPTAASPLLDRAGIALDDAPAATLCAPRDAWLDAALHAGRSAFADALPEALAAGRRAAGLPDGEAVAWSRARLAVLRELDPRDARRSSLGPYLGVVGPLRGPADPRRAAPWVSHLESEARCAWRFFLEKLLSLAPQPDVWRALPAAGDSRLLGIAVHGALQHLCDPGREDSPWPAEAPAGFLIESAREVVRKNGIALPGYARALASTAAAYVEVARALDRAEGPTLLEVEGDESVSLDGPGEPQTLRFRVDRIEERDGARCFTDWKTGRPTVDNKKPDARVEKHRAKLAAGELLQGHAYALTGARARYVYLRPGTDEALRVLDVDPNGSQFAAFEASVATLLVARELGALLPRLRKPDRDEEPRACTNCEVKQACLRGDSGVRRRLGAWVEATGDDAPAFERAALALWQLPESEA
jgi:hypothetical protein